MTRAAALLALLLVVAAPARAGMFPSTYDPEIRRAAEQYWPGMDWRWLKSQLWQESRLDPTARSGVGAEGLAQFMGPTWAEISVRIGYGAYPRTAATPAIDGAAYYMMTLKRSWPQALEFDRHYFGLCSYNAGIGNCLKAARACADRSTWNIVAPCLSQITGGANARQTTTYVARIRQWFAAMVAGS